MTSQKRALLLVAKINCLILETLEECNDSISGGAPDFFGVPESHPYIALQSIGVNLDQYHMIIQNLKDCQAIQVQGHLIKPGKLFRSVLAGQQDLAAMLTRPEVKPDMTQIEMAGI